MDIHLLERLKDIVRSAGTTVRSAQDAAMGIREKSSHVDLVTLYDPMVQEFLRSPPDDAAAGGGLPRGGGRDA